MTTLPILLALASSTAVYGSWITYMATVPSGKVPARPVGHIGAQLLGLGTGTASLGTAAAQVSGLTLAAYVVPNALSLTMGVMFLFLLTQRKTPVGNLTVAVGDTLPQFVAHDRHGNAWTPKDMDGQRVLFKFFRGHW